MEGYGEPVDATNYLGGGTLQDFGQQTLATLRCILCMRGKWMNYGAFQRKFVNAALSPDVDIAALSLPRGQREELVSGLPDGPVPYSQR